MSSFWNFIGGAADTTLDRRKMEAAERMRKEAEERAKEWELQREQRREEQQRFRDMVEAEDKGLQRKREDERLSVADARYEQEKKERQEEKKAQMAQEDRRLGIWEKSIQPRESSGPKPMTDQQRLTYRNNLAKAIENMPDGDIRKEAARAALQSGQLEEAQAILEGKIPETSPMINAAGNAIGSLFRRAIGG